MTKAELVAKIASEGGITKSQADKAVDGFVSAVSGALASGDKITLVGFGTFSVVARSQREGRNPRTGEKITNSGLKSCQVQSRQDSQRKSQIAGFNPLTLR